MISPVQQQVLSGLARLIELSPPDVRIGQLVAWLAFLAEDHGSPGIWDVEDADLLKAVERHLDDLLRRQHSSAEPDVTPTPP
jgi:hypothetical protein